MVSQRSRVSHFKNAIESVHPLALKQTIVSDYQQEMLTLLRESGERALQRDHQRAHFTASSFILSPDGEVLALFHRKLQRWLQPGGHIEKEDPSPLQAALRESAEESQLRDLTPLYKGPIDLDIHGIPGRGNEPAHDHYDIRYAFMTSTPDQATLSEESTGMQWLSGSRLTEWMKIESSIGRPLELIFALRHSH